MGERAECGEGVMHADEPPGLQRMVGAVHMRGERRVPEERGALGVQRWSVAISSRHSPGDMPLVR